MNNLIILLFTLTIAQLIYIFKLIKKNNILHNNNLGLGQALVECGGMTKEQFEKSLNK